MLMSGRKSQGDEVLNLCFHGIGTPGRPQEPDEDLYWVSEARFDELLTVIARHPSVRITFDDGNASDADIALPLLRRHGLTATFFVVSSRIDQPGSLTSAGVKELVRGGMGVGSHGKGHRPWREATNAELDEVACPFGSYDRRVLRAIRSCGFQRVYTVDGGPARSDAWLQSRYTVRATD